MRLGETKDSGPFVSVLRVMQCTTNLNLGHSRLGRATLDPKS